jgi:hypothetical protein
VGSSIQQENKHKAQLIQGYELKRFFMLQFKLFLMGLCLYGCAGTNPVLLPEPLNHTRPVLDWGFYQCTDKKEEVCLTSDDAEAMMLYLVDIETDLRKCAITVEEVNKERKK